MFVPDPLPPGVVPQGDPAESGHVPFEGLDHLDEPGQMTGSDAGLGEVPVGLEDAPGRGSGVPFQEVDSGHQGLQVPQFLLRGPPHRLHRRQGSRLSRMA